MTNPAPAAGSPSRLRHWPLAIILVLFVGLAGGLSAVLPLGEADDETDHFALVRFIAENGRPPLTFAERLAVGPKGDAAPVYHTLVALLSQHVDLATLPDLPATEANPLRLIPSDGFQADRILHTEDELPPWRGIVLAWHLARLVSVPLGAATVVAAYATTLSLWPQRRGVAAAVAGAVAFLPRFAIGSAVVNDDALSLPLVAWSVYGLVRLALGFDPRTSGGHPRASGGHPRASGGHPRASGCHPRASGCHPRASGCHPRASGCHPRASGCHPRASGDLCRRTCLWVGGLIGLAAITKYPNLVLLPEAAIVLAVLAWRPSAARGAALRCLGWLALAGLLTAGWYFAWLWLTFNQVAELGWLRGLIAPLGDPVMTGGLGGLAGATPNGLNATAWLSMLFRSFWLSYGWQHLFAPAWVYWLLGGLCLLAAAGWVLQMAGSRQQGAGSRLPAADYRLPAALVLLLHLLLFLAIVAGRGWLKPAAETAQGRHLYPALTVLAILLVGGLIPAFAGNSVQARARQWILDVLSLASSRLGVLAFGLPVRARQWIVGVLSATLPAGLLALSVAAWPLILAPHYLPYLPIRRLPDGQRLAAPRQPLTVAPGVQLVDYTVHAFEGGCGTSMADAPDRPMVSAGDSLPVTRYWYAAAPPSRDYLARMCLVDWNGQVATCHYSQPVDGRYPMRAWEPGYLIRDTAQLPLPACLPAGTYSVHLALLPLRDDTPAAEIDPAALPPPRDITLGSTCVQPAATAAPDSIVAWTAAGPTQSGRLDLDRLRQSLTLVTVRTWSDRDADSGSDSLLRTPYSLLPESAGAAAWQPVAPPVVYHCPDGTAATTTGFVLHPGVAPGAYRPAGADVPPLSREEGAGLPSPGAAQAGTTTDVTVVANVRRREFALSPTLPGRLAEPVTFAAAPGPRLRGDDVRAGGDQVIALLGVTVDTAARAPGESVTVVATWQALRTLVRPTVVALYLLDPQAGVGGQLDHTLGGHYPNVLWAPGEIVAETYALPVRPGTPAGLYDVQIGLYEVPPGDAGAETPRFLTVTAPDAGMPAESLRLGQVRVRDSAEGLPPTYPLSIDLGGQIRLLGYDLAQPPAGVRQSLAAGGTLDLALHWQATSRPVLRDYTVFTQLIGPDGLVYGQHDNQPQGGRYPTTAWPLGQPVVDRYSLTLRDDAPPGEYRLLVGMYELATGARLPAVGADGARLPDDAIQLTTLAVSVRTVE